MQQDYKEAISWYRKAAEQGHKLAQYNLGSYYENGKGVAQNYEQAVKYYRLAAAKNVTNAQIKLGLAYGQGKGVEQSFLQAYKWIFIAAQTGNSIAKEALEMTAEYMTQEQIAEAIKLAKEEKIEKEEGNNPTIQ